MRLTNFCRFGLAGFGVFFFMALRYALPVSCGDFLLGFRFLSVFLVKTLICGISERIFTAACVVHVFTVCPALPEAEHLWKCFIQSMM